jgi:CMP-N-acetylneuraminic acid synthetase
VTFTYVGDPSVSDVAAVRFEISDTDPSAPLLQDEEIAYAISSESGGTVTASPSSVTLADAMLYCAAARCCEVLARKFAMQADEEIGDLSTTYSKQAVTYATRAKEIRAKAQGMHAPTHVYTRSQKRALEEDCDRVQPAFRRDQFRNPYEGAGVAYDLDLPVSDSPLDG